MKIKIFFEKIVAKVFSRKQNKKIFAEILSQEIFRNFFRQNNFMKIYFRQIKFRIIVSKKISQKIFAIICASCFEFLKLFRTWSSKKNFVTLKRKFCFEFFRNFFRKKFSAKLTTIVKTIKKINHLFLKRSPPFLRQKILTV